MTIERGTFDEICPNDLRMKISSPSGCSFDKREKRERLEIGGGKGWMGIKSEDPFDSPSRWREGKVDNWGKSKNNLGIFPSETGKEGTAGISPSGF